MLIAYNILRYYLLKKIKVKHNWVILVLGLFTIIIQSVLNIEFYTFLGFLFSGLSIIFLLWYMDLKGFLKSSDISEMHNNKKYISPVDKKNKKKDVIKPKSKPNKAMKNNRK